MAHQSHWKAPALAATFSNSTTWGAARPQLHFSGEMGFGMGLIGQPALPGGSVGHELVNASSNRRQKRKASSGDESMGSPSPSPEPAPTSRKIRGLGSSEGRKRTRVTTEDTSAAAGAAGEMPIDKLLEPLSEKDLRLLVAQLVTQNPQLGSQVRQLVPAPTVDSACNQLARLERQLTASYPYNKSGFANDEYTYSRVRPALQELHEMIVMYLNHFTHHELSPTAAATSKGSNSSQYSVTVPHGAELHALSHPAEWFDLLTQATGVASRMPVWSKSSANDIRRDTLRHLAEGWMRAISATARWIEEGHIAGRDMVTQWAHQLEHFYNTAGEPGLFYPAVLAFKQSFGYQFARNNSPAQQRSTPAQAT